jgi:predicted helicase
VVQLTNTLQEAFQIPQASGFMTRIRDEAEAAKEVKQERPVMVVLGNPPYSAVSSNTDPWIVNLVRDYYQVDGKPLGERNPKGLLDDYVKFIRFAQHRISETGYGVVAFITNHGYLDNPTFRGMRQNLMQTFDEIYILDLHGNAKKSATSPDGSTDQNVFDIQQGVAISFFIKHKNSEKKFASIYHADLFGLREIQMNQELVGGKYHWLNEASFNSTHWQILNLSNDFYLFNQHDNEFSFEYKDCWKITDLMPENSTGIKTHRDHFAFDLDFDILQARIKKFRDLSFSDAEIKQKYLIKDTRDWDINTSRKSLANDKGWEKYFSKCLYRPFDLREYYHHDDVVELTKKNVMQHLESDNLGLITSRQQSQFGEWKLSWITQNFIECCSISNKTKEANYLFPLYLYPTDNPTLFEPPPTSAPGGRRPNLDEKFTQEIAQKLNLEFIPDGKGDQTQTFGPEDIFNYIYAVFHSSTYRKRYAEFLKIDFPRVPLTSQTQLFWQLANIGDQLVQIHLMKIQLDEIVGFPIEGDNLIEKITYTEPTEKQNGRVYINKTQYIDNVPSEIYNFYIGGYQVCNKWLKDRKDREFTDDDFEHYSQIVSILKRTIKLMKSIDKIIENYGNFPIQ